MDLLSVQPIATKLYAQYPIIIICAFCVIWFACGVALFLYLFSPSGVESRIVRGANGVGLVAVENRGTRNPIPPAEFFQTAKNEVVVTGVSAYRTFDQNVELIENLIKKGVEVYLLILAPDSEEAQAMSILENKNIPADIHQTILVIRNHKLNTNPGFAIRFHQSMPPFTAIMIDGDVAPIGKDPADTKASIRIQPRAASGSQHQGVILTFQNAEKSPNAFQSFAADVRRQWASATSRPDLLQ